MILTKNINNINIYIRGEKMEGITILLAVVLPALCILTVLWIYEFVISERERNERILEERGAIIFNVLSLLKNTYDTVLNEKTFKNSSLVGGYSFKPWLQEEIGMEVSVMGALVSDDDKIQILVAVPSEINQYVILSKGDGEPYRDFFDKTREGDISEEELINVIQDNHGVALKKDGYRKIELENSGRIAIDSLDLLGINRW